MSVQSSEYNSDGRGSLKKLPLGQHSPKFYGASIQSSIQQSVQNGYSREKVHSAQDIQILIEFLEAQQQKADQDQYLMPDSKEDD